MESYLEQLGGALRGDSALASLPHSCITRMICENERLKLTNTAIWLKANVRMVLMNVQPIAGCHRGFNDV